MDASGSCLPIFCETWIHTVAAARHTVAAARQKVDAVALETDNQAAGHDAIVSKIHLLI